MKNLVLSCFDCNVKDCSILKKCSSESLELINRKKYCMTYHPGQNIVYEGSVIDGLYIIYNGVAKVHVKGHKGRPFILHLARSGDTLGYCEDFEKKQPVSISAVEETIICFIEMDDFNMAKDQSTGIHEQMVAIFKDEIKRVQKRTIHLAQMSVREKIAEALLQIAEAYNISESHPFAHINLSRQEIADLTGTTKEQVSKVFTDLKERKVIDAKGKSLHIVNKHELKLIAGVS